LFLILVLGSCSAKGPPAKNEARPGDRMHKNFKNSLAEKMAKRKEAALEKYIKKVERAGGTTGVNLNKVEQVANGQYVLMKVEDTDNVWTLLGEFSDIKVGICCT
jgi:immune inhibitor A